MKKLLITVNGKKYDVEVEEVQDTGIPSFPPPQPIPSRPTPEPVAAPAPPAALQQFSASKPSAFSGESLISPINGVVLEIPVGVGQSVLEKQPVFVLEAMKMKTKISSPRAGVIASINVAVGDTVETGQILLTYGQ